MYNKKNHEQKVLRGEERRRGLTRYGAMDDVDRPMLRRNPFRIDPYIVSAVICFALVGLLMWGFQQEVADKAAKETKERATLSSGAARGAGNVGELAPPDPETKIREAVERTKGDYAKLTAEEKMRLDDFTVGHGRQYFEVRAAQWKRKTPPAKP